MSRKSILGSTLLLLFFGAIAANVVHAQGNSFNFQGRLNDGTNPANGRYDLTFRLFDAIAGGNPLGQLVSKPNTVLINGVFSVTLDMGPGFSNPNNTFIEISVKPAGSPNAYTILGPRQQLTVVPFAVRAANATNADLATNAQHSIDAQLAVNATNAVTATNALALGGFNASEYPRLNVVNTGALAITGNASQPVTANGFVKAMVYVQQDGTILRCFNSATNSSTLPCGFSVIHSIGGIYRVVFNFGVFDRFLSVTARNPAVASTWVAASFQLDAANPNAIDVLTFITNAGTNGGDAANFMLVVY